MISAIHMAADVSEDGVAFTVCSPVKELAKRSHWTTRIQNVTCGHCLAAINRKRKSPTRDRLELLERMVNTVVADYERARAKAANKRRTDQRMADLDYVKRKDILDLITAERPLWKDSDRPDRALRTLWNKVRTLGFEEHQVWFANKPDHDDRRTIMAVTEAGVEWYGRSPFPCFYRWDNWINWVHEANAQLVGWTDADLPSVDG